MTWAGTFRTDATNVSPRRPAAYAGFGAGILVCALILPGCASPGGGGGGGSGRVVAECADTEIGRKYAADLNGTAAAAAENWMNGYLGSFTSWNYAKGAFDKWAAVLAQRFVALRGA
jgi:hypothetical protein